MLLNDSAINSLFNNNAVVREFPFFRLKKVRSGCCGGVTVVPPAYNSIKAAIAKLPIRRRRVFMTMIGAKELEVIYVDSGRRVEKKFTADDQG